MQHLRYATSITPPQRATTLRLGTYCCTACAIYAHFSACTSCCPSAATLPTAACSTPLVHLLGSPTPRCSAVDRSASASLVAPPTCAAVLCAVLCSTLSCRALDLCRRVTATAADVLSRLVSIGGVALALQLRLTTPLLQSFPAPNYYVSCHVSASLTHARP